MFKCSVCGEVFEKKFNFCPSCGVGNKSIMELNNRTEDSNSIVDSNRSSKKNKKGEVHNQNLNQNQQKQISVVKMIYIGVILLIIGGAVLIGSGVFDTQSVSSGNANITDPHAKAGIDLKSIEEITQLENAVKNNPNDYESLIRLAHLYNDSGFKEKAIERYKVYLKQFPKAADVWVDMGVCIYELGNNEEAIKNMERAVSIDPRHQIAHLNLGVVNFASGNVAIAKNYWKKAVEINPTSDVAKRAQELINQQ